MPTDNAVPDVGAPALEVRAFLAAALPAHRERWGKDSSFEARLAWQRVLDDGGWAAPSWPVADGGRGLGVVDRVQCDTEFARAEAPNVAGMLGINNVGPTIAAFGTEEQRASLPRIRSGEEIWCQGFSEPDAGSDLAALKTRAVRDGDGWVLSGSKTWTTYAPFAQWLFVLARTDPESVRHRGITCFIVPAHAPGVEIRPIRDIAGETEFGEVFLTDVRLGDEHVLGSVNDGWNVAIMTLANERVIESCEDIGELGFMVDRLLDCVRGLPAGTRPAIEDETVRDQVATIWCDLQAVRLMLHRSLVALTRTDMPEPDGSVLKLAWSELAQRVALLGVQRFGGASTADDRSIDVAAYWHHCYLMARATTIYAGTSEILRSVIAERVLGLPRSR
jgi:alkylation response protein AidB-like acyl-CoA dehydrogenase